MGYMASIWTALRGRQLCEVTIIICIFIMSIGAYVVVTNSGGLNSNTLIKCTVNCGPSTLRELNTAAANSAASGIDGKQKCGSDIRPRHIDDVCSKWKTTRHIRYQDPGTYWAMLVDDTHKILYCIVPKAGCTSFQNMIINSTGLLKDPDEMAVHDPKILEELNFKYLHQYSMEEIIWRLEHYFKFTVVRHPFDRIYSAYRDKVKPNPEFNLEKFGWLDTIKKYFPSYEPRNKTLDLEQYLTLVVNEYDRVFKDRHWALYDELCHPCDIKYDYVIKLETLEQDLPTLVEKITSSNGHPPPHLPKLHARVNSPTIEEVYKNVPPSLMRRLYSLYQMDFELFGYTWSENFTRNSLCAIKHSSEHCC